MTGPLFTINFRRASWEQSRAEARRRVVRLGVGVAYAGVVGILLGLFGLNCALMSSRTTALERRVQRLRVARAAAPELRLDPADVTLVQRAAANPRLWRDKLARLAELLPPNARLTSLAVNPDRAAAPAEQLRLVISGTIRTGPERDRVQPVVRLVESLRRDAVFAAGFQNLKLISSRVPDAEGAAVVEFVVECR